MAAENVTIETERLRADVRSLIAEVKADRLDRANLATALNFLGDAIQNLITIVSAQQAGRDDGLPK